MFTGFGALVALLIFLPLPARLQKGGLSPELALKHSFYVVAAVAFILTLWCFAGLRNLKREADRDQTQNGWIWHNLIAALDIGFRRPDIALGYAGGFVARASSVGISLFIPLLINAAFLSSDLCQTKSSLDTPAGLPDIRRRCPKAFILAAEMTGICVTRLHSSLHPSLAMHHRKRAEEDCLS